MLLPVAALYAGIHRVIVIVLGACSGFIRARTSVSLGTNSTNTPPNDLNVESE